MNFTIVYPKDIENLRRQRRAILVDIRSRDAYRQEHWEGAINYPEEEQKDYTRLLQRNRFIIFYCEHGGASMQLARSLGKQGYETGTVVGGYEGMRNYKLKRRS